MHGVMAVLFTWVFSDLGTIQPTCMVTSIAGSKYSEPVSREVGRDSDSSTTLPEILSGRIIRFARSLWMGQNSGWLRPHY